MTPHEEAPESTWGLVIAVGLGGLALVYGASLWPALLTATGVSSGIPLAAEASVVHPFAELLKMIVAALIGIAVTTVHRRFHRDKALPRSLMQAQVLLCVAGAVVMILIGNSVARAFGVAGAAGIVRFRTPVEDPKDTTILFLLVSLGMACGVGLIEVAALGTVFLCIVLVVLDHFGDPKARYMTLSLVAMGSQFPNEHVNHVLGSTVEHYEAREVIQGSEAVTKFHVTLNDHAPLAWISQQLLANGSGLKSVSWSEPSKKGL